MRPVPPVAGLGQGVGPEGGELLRGQQVVDPAVVGRGIEVVHQPGALVADVLVVLETGRAAHGSHDSSRARPRTRNSPRGTLTLGLLTAFDPCSVRADPAARPSVSLTLPVRRRSLPNGPDQGSQNFHSAGPPPFSVASKIPSRSARRIRIPDRFTRRRNRPLSTRPPRWPGDRPVGSRRRRGPARR